MVTLAYYLVFLTFSLCRKCFLFFFVTKPLCFIVQIIHQASSSAAWCSVAQKHHRTALVHGLLSARSEHRSIHMCFTVQIAQMSLSYCVCVSFDPAHFRWFCNVFFTIALRIEGFIMSLLNFHFVIKTLWNFRF